MISSSSLISSALLNGGSDSKSLGSKFEVSNYSIYEFAGASDKEVEVSLMLVYFGSYKKPISDSDSSFTVISELVIYS